MRFGRDGVFKIIDRAQVTSSVTVLVDGVAVDLPADVNVAAGLLCQGVFWIRNSVVRCEKRAPFCMIGQCFECQVSIDDDPGIRACQIRPREGMNIFRAAAVPGSSDAG